MSSILQKQIGFATSITVVTTAETFAVYSGRLEANYPTTRNIIRAWMQIALSAGTTSVRFNIRRGNGLTGAVVGGGTNQNFAASSTVDSTIIFSEQLLNAEFADYSLSVTVNGASANSTINFASIEVESING